MYILCVYVCVYIYIYIHMYACPSVSVCAKIDACTSMHLMSFGHDDTYYVYIYIYIYIHIFLSLSLYIYI